MDDTTDTRGEFAPLLRAVIARQDDDVTRLVAADFLEERGHAQRAAYIRASVELASHVRDERYEEEYLAAGQAVASVPAEAVWGWLKWDGLPLPTPHMLTRDLVADADRLRSVHHDATVGIRRGFAALIRCPLGAWWMGGGAWTAAAPLERVEATDGKPYPHRRNEWVWRRREGSGPGNELNVLPDDVFDRLPDAQGNVAVYGTRRKAEDALSVACLALGRLRGSG